ncbi:MAG: hypothetical protein LBS30_00870 [Planctomycetota bacterium]|jgi:hypothetical protein|nr:hypothetical protein [Planctomycetota bacterium]
MANNPTINFRDSALVRKTGMSALRKELGAVGAAYFIRQFSVGRGDYTAERDGFLRGITAEEIIRSVREAESG